MSFLSKLFNKKPNDSIYHIPDNIKEAVLKGEVTKTLYHCTRAFEVGEFEDEGLHYILYVGNHQILYLTGQDLYDFQPIIEGSEIEPRKFPCENFYLYHRKNTEILLKIEPLENPFEPEQFFDERMIFTKELAFFFENFTDGSLLNYDYDALKILFQHIEEKLT